jgi:hypothetical protein
MQFLSRLLIASSLLLVPAASALAAPNATPIKKCGSVTGAPWVFPGTGGKVQGNTYGVTSISTPCAFAKQWATRLSAVTLPGKVAGKSYPLVGGPPGFTCKANPDAYGKVLAASCIKRGVKGTSFSFGGAPKRP